MKKYAVNLTSEAISDMNAANSFMTGFYSDERRIELMGELRDEILSLDTMPLRYRIPPFPICEELGLHRMLVGQYSVFYSVDEDDESVTVTDIIWSAADFENWLGRRYM